MILQNRSQLNRRNFKRFFNGTNPALDEVKNDSERIERIRGELADIFLYALDVSVLLGLDTETLIREKFEKVKKKYPARTLSATERHIEPGSKEDVAYWEAKQRQRQSRL